MRRHTRSDQLDARNGLDLRSLHLIFSRTGLEHDNHLLAATTLMMLLENDLIMTREGRSLFKVCRPLVKGTVWEDALFPPPPDPEIEALKRELDKRWEHINGLT